MVDVCVLGPSTSFLQEELVSDLDPRTHQGGDDVVFDFSIRVRHAATSDGVEDASRWWTRPQERIVRLGSIAIPRQSLNAECAVRLRAHGVQSLELSARAQTARQRQPDAARRLSCLAAGTAETEHGGS
jgi:hypothetical protein